MDQVYFILLIQSKYTQDLLRSPFASWLIGAAIALMVLLIMNIQSAYCSLMTKHSIQYVHPVNSLDVSSVYSLVLMYAVSCLVLCTRTQRLSV